MTPFFPHRHPQWPNTNAEAGLISWKLTEDTALPVGVHLVTPRHGDCHHRLDAGDGKVLQSARLCRFLHRGLVEEVGIAHFAANHAMWSKPSPVPQYAGQEAVRRARSRLGENRYRLLTNNCEQFCSWCIYGESFSEPVDACLSLPRATLLVTRGLCKSFLKTRSAALHRWLDNAARLQGRTSSQTKTKGMPAQAPIAI